MQRGKIQPFAPVPLSHTLVIHHQACSTELLPIIIYENIYSSRHLRDVYRDGIRKPINLEQS